MIDFWADPFVHLLLLKSSMVSLKTAQSFDCFEVKIVETTFLKKIAAVVAVLLWQLLLLLLLLFKANHWKLFLLMRLLLLLLLLLLSGFQGQSMKTVVVVVVVAVCCCYCYCCYQVFKANRWKLFSWKVTLIICRLKVPSFLFRRDLDKTAAKILVFQKKDSTGRSYSFQRSGQRITEAS